MQKKLPILVIDLTKDDLTTPSDDLEANAVRAAKQLYERIEEIHWRIGNQVIFKTAVQTYTPRVAAPGRSKPASRLGKRDGGRVTRVRAVTDEPEL